MKFRFLQAPGTQIHQTLALMSALVFVRRRALGYVHSSGLCFRGLRTSSAHFNISQIDDKPINELNVTEYRKHIALVSQEPVSILVGKYSLLYTDLVMNRRSTLDLSASTSSLVQPNPFRRFRRKRSRQRVATQISWTSFNLFPSEYLIIHLSECRLTFPTVALILRSEARVRSCLAVKNVSLIPRRIPFAEN